MKQKIIICLFCISTFLVQVSYANTCGNTLIEPGEECDDGNIEQSDGCNASCMNEFCGDTIVTNGTWISNQAVVSGANSETLCTDIQVSLFLEGAFDSGSTNMRTTLHEQLLLPGQSGGTPTGHPYTINPWYYTGNEGHSYDFTLRGENKAHYPDNTVDWVLISIRDTESPTSTTCQLAGLLQNDGQVIFTTDGDRCCYLEEGQDYYIVAEHRNHLIAMSPSPQSVVNNIITYDFRSQQSYEDDPFGLGLYAKQKELIPGIYGLFAGNAYQQTDMIGNANDTDINSHDGSMITNNLGIIGYNSADVNLNGLVANTDESIFDANAPIFTSVTLGNPKSPSPTNQKTPLYEHTLYEEVDDGNTNNFDTAPNDCKLAVCGDGIIEGGEECELTDPSSCAEKEHCTNSCLCIVLSHGSTSSITHANPSESNIETGEAHTSTTTITVNEPNNDTITTASNNNTGDSAETKNSILSEISALKKTLESKTKQGVHYFIGTPKYLKTGRTIENGIKELSIDTRISKNVIVESPTWGKPHFGNYPKDLEYWIDTVLKPYDPEGVDSSMFLLIPEAGYLIPIQQVTKESEQYNKLIKGEEIDIAKDLQMFFAKGALHHAGSVEPGQYGRSVLAMHTSWFIEGAGKYPTIGQLLLTLEKGDAVHVFKKKPNKTTYERFDFIAQETKVIGEHETGYLYPDYGKELLLYGCTPIGTSKDRMITILRTSDSNQPDIAIKRIDKLKIDRAFNKITSIDSYQTEGLMIELRKKTMHIQQHNNFIPEDKHVITYLMNKIASLDFSQPRK